MSSLRVVVAGYSSLLGVYTVSEDSVTRAGEWEVDPDMTWLQLDGDNIWAGHEVGQYQGEEGSVVSRWKVSSSILVVLYL